MYRLVIHKHPLLFLCALLAGLTAAIYFPHFYPEQLVEIPIVALYFGEMGLALLLTLLFYENASTSQIVRLSATTLGISMMVGAIANFGGTYFGLQTQFLPDSFVLISWVQLAAMNLTGVLGCLTLYRLKRPEELERPAKTAVEEPEPEPEAISTPQDYTEAAADAVRKAAALAAESAGENKESAKEILDGLDISRINRLERSLRPQQVSLETLFKDADVDHTDVAAKAAASIAMDTDAVTALPANPASTNVDTTAAISLPGKSTDNPVKTMRGVRLDDLPKGEAASAAAPKEETGKAAEKDNDDLDLGALLRGLKDEISNTVPPGKEAPSGISRFQQLLKGELDEPTALGDSVMAPPDTVTGSADNVMSDDVASELDDIFAKLVPDEAQMDFSAERLAQKRAAAAESDDEDEEPIALDEKPEASAPAAKEPLPAKEVKEFGRLSGDKSKKESQDETTGTMKTIGKMLLDAQAVENIIKAGSRSGGGLTRAKVVSETQGRDIESLLEKIDQNGGTVGSVVVGHDGLVMSTTLKESGDKDLLGTLSLAIYSSANLASQKLELGHLHQIVLQSKDKITVLTEVGEGVLGVYANSRQKGKLNNLIKSIKNAIEGEEDFSPEPLEDEDESSDVIALADEAIALSDDAIALPPPPAAAPAAVEEAPIVAAAAPVERPKTDEEKLSESGIFRKKEAEGKLIFETVVKAKIDDSLDDLFGDLDEKPIAAAAEPIEEKKIEEEKPIVAAAKSVDDIIGLGEERPVDDILDEPAVAPSSTKSSSNSPKAVAADQVRDLLESLSASQKLQAIKLDEPEPAPAPKVEAPKAAKAEELELEFEAEPLPATPVKAEAKAEVKAEVKAEAKTEVKAEVKAEEPKAEVKQPQIEAQEKPAVQSKEVKGFGKLATAAPVSQDQDQTGSMKTIGKMLIDAQAISNIIKAGETGRRGLTTARVISAARGEGIRSLLGQVDTYKGVAGSLIVGHDGLVIASTLPAGMDKDTLGAGSPTSGRRTVVSGVVI